MSDTVQLELNLQEKSLEQMTLDSMQKQIELMHESMHKVRRKLFGEMGELKKLFTQIQQENEYLRAKIAEIAPQKTEWLYQTEEALFELSGNSG